MQISPRLPPGSSSFIHPNEGKVVNQEVQRGEGQNPPLPTCIEEYGETRTKGFSSLRELIHLKLFLKGISIPGKQQVSIIERFLSEGHPFEYLSRIAVVKQFLDKNLPLSMETVRSLYRAIEGREDPEDLSKGESHLPSEPSAVPCQTDGFLPLKDFQTKKLIEDFNGRNNRRGKWMVVPFSCSLEGTLYHGCLRLYGRGETASKVVLSLRRHASNGLPWYFVWFPQEPKPPLRMYPPFRNGKEFSIPDELLEAFRKKLRKIGFILDDNKNSSTGFDGFDEIEGNLQNIDVWI